MRNIFTRRRRRPMNGIRLDSEPRYASGEREATILAVATVKGGVGKTTTAVSLAAGFARRPDTRVLLIDLDAQGHCTACLAAHRDEEATPETPLSELLLAPQARALEVLDARISSGLENLDLTPADPGLAEAEGRISQKIGKEMLLHDALQVTRSHYDLIVIDSPPNKGNLTLNALRAADYVLIPTDLSPLGVQGAEELMDTVHTVNHRLGASLELLGVLLTRFDGRNATINRQLLEELEAIWSDLLLETRIGINIDLAKSQLAGENIFDHAPRSRGAACYSALVDELAGRLEL